MSENDKIKQLENKVELLSRIVLENDFCQKELCVMALKNGWSADIPDKIMTIMNEFVHKREEYTYKDIDASLTQIIETAYISTIIEHFYRYNSCTKALAIYLDTYLKKNYQSALIPFEYERMHMELKSRTKIHPAANPLYRTPLPYYDKNRYAKKYKSIFSKKD